ncbi:hypothetical protein KAS50_05255, partial [bacterium]|nr:hypothetical protein [bacterium]
IFFYTMILIIIGFSFTYAAIDSVLVKPSSFNLSPPTTDSNKVFWGNEIIHPGNNNQEGHPSAGDTILFTINFYDSGGINPIHFTNAHFDSITTYNLASGTFQPSYIDYVDIDSMVAVGVFPYVTDLTEGVKDSVHFTFYGISDTVFSWLPTVFTTVKALTIHIDKVQALQGDILSLPLILGGGYSPSDSLLAFEFGVRYDNTILDFTSVSTGSIASGFSVMDSLTADTIFVSCAYYTPVVSEGDLLKLNFIVKTTASYGDTSELKIVKAILNEYKPLAAVNDGQVLIKPIFGDADRNGYVGALDATHILKYRVYLASIDSVDSIHADVSRRGGITAYDAGLILQWLVAAPISRRFPVEDSLGLKVPVLNPYAELITRRVEDYEYSDQYEVVAVELKNINMVFSIEMALPYDAALYEFSDYRVPGKTDGFYAVVNDDGGRILTAMTGCNPVTEDGRVIEFIFRKKKSGSYEWYVSHAMINEQKLIEKSAESKLPLKYGLFQNYPNPFNPETQIRYIIPE